MTIDLVDRETPTTPVVAGSSALVAFPVSENDRKEGTHRKTMADEGVKMENRDRAHGKAQIRIDGSNKQTKLTANDTVEVRGEGHDFAQLNTGESGNGKRSDPLEQKEWNEAQQVAVVGRNRFLAETDQEPQLQKCQQLQQSSSVHWERFLPQIQLKILLVEYDDATRHVVSALLRNCSYKVTAVSNGLQAWELLEDASNDFDLVLTEVVIPYLSGIGLLCKITAHEAYKHIPVIMMSSHDSMGIVFKCLSKGAVDFLVKPVRKNELKNLWQHVWRRWHASSSSGNRSEHMHEVYEQKSEAGSGNNTGSNHDSDDVSSSLNNGDGSDNGSGTQSSWTRRAVEVESPRFRNMKRTIFIGPPTEVLNATMKSENCVQDAMPCSGPYVMENNDHMGQLSQIATLRPAATVAKLIKTEMETGDSVYAGQECALSASNLEGKQNEDVAAVQGTGSGECSNKTIDLIGGIGSCEHKGAEEHGDSCDKGDKIEEDTVELPRLRGEFPSCSIALPALELSLKRRPCGETDGDGGERKVLRQSGSSAFYKYNTSGSCTQLPSPKPIPTYTMPPGFVGLPLIQGNTGGTSNIQFLMPAERARPGKNADVLTPLAMHAQGSHGNNLEDVNALLSPSSQVGKILAKEENTPVSRSGPLPPIPFSGSSIRSHDGVPAAYGPLHPMFYSQCPAPPWAPPASTVPDRETCDQSSNTRSQVLHPEAYRQPYNYKNDNHHHHHHHHHHVQHHHHHYQKPASSQIPQQDEQIVTVTGTGAPQCGSSNQVAGPEGNNGQSGSSNGYGSNGNGNGSVNGSATGSNNGSNEPNGHSNGQNAAALVVGGSGDYGAQNVNSGSGAASNSMAPGNVCTGLAVCTDDNRVARREAALTKFRQKRKERCFEKKVRYQSRKRLAEQRPRVRGQFVRQSVLESTIGECEADL